MLLNSTMKAQYYATSRLHRVQVSGSLRMVSQIILAYHPLQRINRRKPSEREWYLFQQFDLHRLDKTLTKKYFKFYYTHRVIYFDPQIQESLISKKRKRKKREVLIVVPVFRCVIMMH